MANSDKRDPTAFLYHNQAYCDWRVTMSCEDGEIYRLLYILDFILALLVAIACIILLWYRIGRQGHTVFLPKIPGTGFIRPSPVEGLLVWEIPWLIGRLLFIVVLWTDIFKDNYLVLEMLQWYWTCGATGYAWFVIGTYLQIGSQLNSWRPNNKLSDICLVLMTMILPMTIWPVTFASGYFRDNENVRVADLLISIRYMIWAIWCGFGALGTFYFCKELCNMLSYRISATDDSRMQSGLKKIRRILYIIFSIYIYFFIYCPFTSIFRVWIMTHSKPLNIFMFVTYAFVNPLCILFVVGTISIRIIQGFKYRPSKSASNSKLVQKGDTHLAISIPDSSQRNTGNSSLSDFESNSDLYF